VGPASQAPPPSSSGLLGMLLGGSMMGGGGYRGQEPVLSANFAFDLSYPFTL
jgi:predicted lipid-binding transport protein (Tim44 family)